MLFRSAKRLPRAVRRGHNLRGIAFAPRRDLDLEIDASHALDGIDHLQHRKAMTVAAIGGQRRPAAAQMAQRIGMCAGKIADVNIVANAGAVRRRIVVAEDVELCAQAKRCFDRDLDQVRRRPPDCPARQSGSAPATLK